MAHRVVLIASGDTERLALPLLLAPLIEAGVLVPEIRVPPHNRDVRPEIVERLIKGIYWEFRGRNEQLDKIVVLKDADGKTPEEILRPFDGLQGRLGLGIDVLVTYAQQHLEAWFFADAPGLRQYLGRDLGNVDVSSPDTISNPKLHLRNLLGQNYTSLTAQA
jgi:hypothetical protein